MLAQRFALACRRLGLEPREGGDLDTTLFRAPHPAGNSNWACDPLLEPVSLWPAERPA